MLKKIVVVTAAFMLIAGVFIVILIKGSGSAERNSAADDIINETDGSINTGFHAEAGDVHADDFNDDTDIMITEDFITESEDDGNIDIPEENENNDVLESTADDGTMTSDGDFIIGTESNGLKYVLDYVGNGGDIRIPDEADGVYENAFKDNADITGVTFPAGCRYMLTGAFQYCANLEKIVFEGDVSFGESSFGTCPSLESVIVEGSVMNIETKAFYECTSLKTVKFYGNEYDFEIGVSAFQECHSLESINIPDKCQYIGSRAFLNCIGMTELTIPEYTRMIYTYDRADYNTYDEPFNFGMFETFDIDEYGAIQLAGPTHKENKVNGRTYFSRDKYSGDDAEPFEYSENIVFKTEELTPKDIILIVIDDSDAYRYAVEWGIKIKLYDGTVDGKLAAPNSFMGSYRQTEIDLKWFPIDGADGYRVFMYSEETDRYEKYMDVTDAACTIIGLTANTEYKIRVAALVKVGDDYIPQTPSFSLDAKTSE